MKVVLGYIAWSHQARMWHEGVAARARALGWEVEAFCLTPGDPAPRYSFADLDRLWRSRNAALVDLKLRLKQALTGADVFWNFNGANVHPAWLAEFDCLNVYGCFDDPESSAELSEPVAHYADACLIGNLSCAPLYESWGVRRHAWAPLAFIGDDFDPRLTPERVLAEERPLDVVFFGEREAQWRRERLDALVAQFPGAFVRGRGWPGGFVSVEERRFAYRQARIGWNLHNSVGPVNLRFFALLANGILQLCDNKCRAGQVLRLGDEAVGFDTVEECAELTRYYLAHEDERRRIAANGLAAYRERFSEEKIWRYYFEKFSGWCAEKDRIKRETPLFAPPRRKGKLERVAAVAQGVAARLGYQIRPRGAEGDAPAGLSPVPYRENAEAGGVNLSEKIARKAEGGHFEWPNMVALNWACARLVGGARRIVELGGGTGCFASEAAADPARAVLCLDRDAAAVAWAKEERPRDNVIYRHDDGSPVEGEYDLAVAVDVVEHVADYNGFLATCCRIADRAIITTPNRRRDAASDSDGPPAYYQHVREWSAGEFYWVLKSYYREVKLYAMPHPYIPELRPVTVTSTLTPLVADCSGPLRGAAGAAETFQRETA